MEMIYDVKKAASHFLLKWSSEDVKRLNSEELVELFYKNPYFVHNIEEIPARSSRSYASFFNTLEKYTDLTL
jgi:hypothetical protein